MEAYGLDDPSFYLMIEYTEISSNTSEEEEEDSAQRQVLFAVGARDEDGRYFVSREGSGEVHTISASSLEPFLTAEADTYRSLMLSYATMDEVAEVTLNYQGKAYTFIQTERRPPLIPAYETVRILMWIRIRAFLRLPEE